MTLVGLVQLIGLVYSMLHAVKIRADAFMAAGKQSKKFWVTLLSVLLGFHLLVAGSLSFLLSPSIYRIDPIGLVGVIASIASIVYIVDVRPAINEVLRGPRW